MLFGFHIYLEWGGRRAGGPGERGVRGGARGVVWKGFVRRNDAAIRGDSGGLCASYTARSDSTNTHKQEGICQHRADMVFP